MIKVNNYSCKTFFQSIEAYRFSYECIKNYRFLLFLKLVNGYSWQCNDLRLWQIDLSLRCLLSQNMRSLESIKDWHLNVHKDNFKGDWDSQYDVKRFLTIECRFNSFNGRYRM